MKTLVVVMGTLGWVSSLFGQGLVNNGSVVTTHTGAVVTINGSVSITGIGAGHIALAGPFGHWFVTGNWHNDNFMEGIVGDHAHTVHLCGTQSVMSGGEQSRFRSLVINVVDTVRMETSIAIADTLYLQHGIGDLYGNDISFTPNGYLHNENDTTFITESIPAGGALFGTKTVLSPIDENLFGLGLHVASADSLGTITTLRRHEVLDLGGGYTSIRRWHGIMPQSATAGAATVTFGYLAHDIVPFNPAEYTVFTRMLPYTVWTPQASQVDPVHNTLSCSVDSVFGWYTLGLVPTEPLGVTIVEVTSACDDDIPHLVWYTADQTALAAFIIESSSDAVNWQVIGSVPGAGNSASGTMYEYFDTNGKGGYYRISYQDYDGVVTVLPSLSTYLVCDDACEPAIAPNPNRGTFRVLLCESLPSVACTVRDVYGRIVSEQHHTVDGALITTVVAPGMYSVQMGDQVISMIVYE